MFLRKLLKDKTVMNAGWLISGKIAQMLINFVVGLLTARYLGPSNSGLLSYATAYITFFTAICTLGINSVLVKELIDRPKEQGTTMGTAIGLRAIASILSAITLVGVTMIVDAGERTTIAVVSLSGLRLIFQVSEEFNYWFQSRLESKVTAIAGLTAFFLTAVYKVILLITGSSVIWFACATALDYLLLGIFLLAVYSRKNGGKLRFSKAYAKTLLRKSCYFILPTLMTGIYAQTDKLMLKQMMSATEVGYYATASQLCIAWCFVLAAIIDSMSPSALKAHQTDRGQFDRINRRMYALIFYISVVVSALITLGADWAIEFFYGEAFLPAVAPLRIITWFTAFTYLGLARDIWVVCKDCQKYLIYVYLSAAVANVALNALLIPLWGMIGAAIASLVAQLITIFIAPLLIKPMRPNTRLMLEAILLKDVFPRKSKS